MAYAPMKPSDDPIAQILAFQQRGFGSQAPIGQMQTVSEPFVWGKGGARLTPQQLAAQQASAQDRMKSDYSPVQSIWQGLGRVADNVTGALDARSLDKEALAQTKDADARIASLLPGTDPNIVAGLSSLDPRVSSVAEALYKASMPKQGAPHYWETNDGSLAVVGPDGRPQVLYQDPTPKINWIQADNGDGTKSLIPVGPNGPVGAKGGDPVSGAQAGQPPATLPPDFDFGGPTQPASGGFPR